MKRKTMESIAAALVGLLVLSSCSAGRSPGTDNPSVSIGVIGGADQPTSIIITDGTKREGYVSISMEEAEKLFPEAGDYIILDVRRADEFAEGHIPGALNLANEDIGEEEPEELPDKEQRIFVYCRSGNRSKQASEKLVAMGYTNIIEFGGIIDWTGEIEK